jgi:hypothetical protein
LRITPRNMSCVFPLGMECVLMDMRQCSDDVVVCGAVFVHASNARLPSAVAQSKDA